MLIIFFSTYIYAQGDNTSCSNAIPTVATIFDRVKCPGLNTITKYIDKGLDKISKWIYATTALTSINDQCMNPYEGLDLNDPLYCNNQGGFKKLKQYLAFEFMYAGVEGYQGDSAAASSPLKYRSTFNNQMALFFNKNDYKFPETLISTKRKEYLKSIHDDMTNNPLLIAYAGEYCEKVVGEFSGELFTMSSTQCVSMDNIQKSQNDTSIRLEVESKKNIYYFEQKDKNIIDKFGMSISNNGATKDTYGNQYQSSFNQLKKNNLSTMRSHLVKTKSYKAMQKSCLALATPTITTVSTEKTVLTQQQVKDKDEQKTLKQSKAQEVPTAQNQAVIKSQEVVAEVAPVIESTTTETQEVQTLPDSNETLTSDETISSVAPTITPSINQNTISLTALLEIIKLLVPVGQNNPPPQIPYYNSMPSYPIDPAFLPSPYPYGGYAYPSGASYQQGPSYLPAPYFPGPYSPQQQPQQPILDVFAGISKLFDAMGQPINVSLQ